MLQSVNYYYYFLFWYIRPQLASSLDHVELHQDNAPAHTSQKTQLEIDLLEFQCLKHPPYSPDLAPMDFAVFLYIKSFLRGMRFDNLSELRQAVTNVIFQYFNMISLCKFLMTG